MALFISINHGTETNVVEWHIRQSNPIENHNVHKVTEVQADSDELDYISNRFVNLPDIDSDTAVRAIYWFGDNARFIVGNLI